MSRSSKKKIRTLAGLALCAALVAGMGLTASAYVETGSITIQPAYGSLVIGGGSFDIYHVATLDSVDPLGYTLKGAFAAAEDTDGLDIGSVKSAEQVESAAAILKNYISYVPADDVITLNRATDGDTVGELALGIYLVMQTSAPSGYTAAAPFLAYIPIYDSDAGGWEFDVAANPKLGYSGGGYSVVGSNELTNIEDNPTALTDLDSDTTGLTDIEDGPIALTDLDGDTTELMDVEDDPTALTYMDGDTTEFTDIKDDSIALTDAPQTGMLQWPIPVLAVFGAACVLGGATVGHGRNKRGK